jgi:hypothetical protein
MMKRSCFVPGGTSCSVNAGDCAWQEGMPAQENEALNAFAPVCKAIVAAEMDNSSSKHRAKDISVIPQGDALAPADAHNEPNRDRLPAAPCGIAMMT